MRVSWCVNEWLLMTDNKCIEFGVDLIWPEYIRMDESGLNWFVEEEEGVDWKDNY